MKILNNTTIFRDERGSILNLIPNSEFNSVIHITSKAGSKRAFHSHIRSGHFCVLIKGELFYYERPIGSNSPFAKIKIVPYVPFWTPPLTEHAMVFTADSEMFTFGTGCRTPEEYEKDTVRFDLGFKYNIEEESMYYAYERLSFDKTKATVTINGVEYKIAR